MKERLVNTAQRTLICVIALLGMWSHAQTGEQKALEARKEQLENEIREINRLLFAERKQKGSVLDQMEALNQKINRFIDIAGSFIVIIHLFMIYPHPHRR